MSGVPTQDEMIAEFNKATKAIEASKHIAKSEAKKAPMDVGSDEGKRRVRSIVDRIVRLTEERKSISSDINDIYTEAASAGFSKKALRIAVREEMEDADQRSEREAAEVEASLIRAALGDFASSPLGEFASKSRERH